MYKVFYLLMMLLAIREARAGNGIFFERNLRWREIQEKAKRENKYIFVDCFATWCGPCKEMDRNVFSSREVGEFVNDKFVSIRMQMDTTKFDDIGTRKAYGDAHNIMLTFKISSFPCYLFFSPNGGIVHREIGYKNVRDFLTLTQDAMDTSKQYYTLIKGYRNGRRDFKIFPYLIKTAEKLKESGAADSIASDYIHNYLLNLSDESFYSKQNSDNIYLIPRHINSKDKAFKLFYNNGGKIDKIMWAGYSQSVVDYIITKEEIDPELFKNFGANIEPNWVQCLHRIERKYNKEYADRVILNSRLRWFTYTKDWIEIAKCNIQKIDRYGLDTSGIKKILLNNMIWEVFFQHNTDTAILNKGIKWSRVLVESDPSNAEWIDTYANLLYKVGQTTRALLLEEKAQALDPENINIRRNFERMKKGEHTWRDI